MWEVCFEDGPSLPVDQQLRGLTQSSALFVVFVLVVDWYGGLLHPDDTGMVETGVLKDS